MHVCLPLNLMVVVNVPVSFWKLRIFFNWYKHFNYSRTLFLKIVVFCNISTTLERCSWKLWSFATFQLLSNAVPENCGILQHFNYSRTLFLKWYFANMSFPPPPQTAASIGPGTDAACRCGCVKQHAFCLIPCVRNAVRFICIFRRRLVCKWRRIGPCCSDWTMFYKMSCNRLWMKIITHADEEETNTMLLVGRFIGSHREVGERERGR